MRRAYRGVIETDGRIRVITPSQAEVPTGATV